MRNILPDEDIESGIKIPKIIVSTAESAVSHFLKIKIRLSEFRALYTHKTAAASAANK